MAMSNLWLRKFDRERDFVVRRRVRVGNTQFAPGEPFDKSLVPTRRLRQMFDQRIIMFADQAETEFRGSNLTTLRQKFPGKSGHNTLRGGVPIDQANAQIDLLRVVGVLGANKTVISLESEDGKHQSQARVVKGRIEPANGDIPARFVLVMAPVYDDEDLDEDRDETDVDEPETDETQTDEPETETDTTDSETQEASEPDNETSGGAETTETTETGEGETSEDDVEALKAEAEALGLTIDGRWGAKRLKQEIAAAKAE